MELFFINTFIVKYRTDLHTYSIVITGEQWETPKWIQKINYYYLDKIDKFQYAILFYHIMVIINIFI